MSNTSLANTIICNLSLYTVRLSEGNLDPLPALVEMHGKVEMPGRVNIKSVDAVSSKYSPINWLHCSTLVVQSANSLTRNLCAKCVRHWGTVVEDTSHRQEPRHPMKRVSYLWQARSAVPLEALKEDTMIMSAHQWAVTMKTSFWQMVSRT